MTIEEIAKKYDISESTIRTSFPRAQKTIMKKYNVKIVKQGRGANVTYEIETVQESDCRAITLYEELKEDIAFDTESVHLMSWPFLVLLTIVSTPMLVFRGSYEDFLNYIQLKITKSNLEGLKEALQELTDKEYISYTHDKTNDNYFVAALYRQKEEQMHIGIKMIKSCKEIAQEAKKRSWVPMLKTWIGMQMMADRGTFTMQDLMKTTGLSQYQIRESRKLLERNEIFRTSQTYADYCTCLGTTVELNAFYN